MPKYTSEQYSKIFWKLPAEIRDVITSYSTTEHLRIIGQKHNLHIDKIGDMVEVTFDAMMGIVSTKDFVKELSTELGISLIDASVLARDIDENVFGPIKQTMINLYRNGAPYKPSSSLVQFYEEDDEHLESKKDEILKEIEEPAEVFVRKEITMNPVTIHNTPKVENKIVEYHEEIKNTSSSVKKPLDVDVIMPSTKNTVAPQEPKSVILSHDQTPVLESSPTDFLNKIAGMKLSGTFVMPKEEDIINLGKSEVENKTLTNKPLNTGIINPVAKEISTKVPDQSVLSKVKIDPYREQI